MTEQKERQWAKNWLSNEYAEIKGKNVLVIHDFQNALKLAVNNQVTYITDDESKFARFNKYVCNNLSFGKDDQAILINDWKKELNKELNKMPKFDVIIGNPPYGESGMGSLDLHFEISEILLNSYNDKMIILMPNRLAFSTSNKFDKWKKKFDMISEITNENNPFGQDARVLVGIHVFENHKVDQVKVFNKVVPSLMDISPFSNYEAKFMKKLHNEKPNYNAYRPLGKNKIEKAEEFNNNYFKRFRYNATLVISNLANGGINGQFFPKKRDKNIFEYDELKDFLFKTKNSCKVISEFSSTVEAENYVAALKRPLCRFGLVKLQDDQSMTERVYSYIPNVDWSDERTKTDEGILEMVGFSKEEASEFTKYTKEFIKKVDEK